MLLSSGHSCPLISICITLIKLSNLLTQPEATCFQIRLGTIAECQWMRPDNAWVHVFLCGVIFFLLFFFLWELGSGQTQALWNILTKNWINLITSIMSEREKMGWCVSVCVTVSHIPFCLFVLLVARSNFNAVIVADTSHEQGTEAICCIYVFPLWLKLQRVTFKGLYGEKWNIISIGMF